MEVDVRDYQRLTRNPYRLEHGLWMQTLWLIRRYEHLKDEYNLRIDEGMSPDTGVVPSGKTNKTGDPTSLKAMKLAEISKQIMAIEKSKSMIPEEYIRGVWNNIMVGAPYPRDADPRTYGRYKSRFVYMVAENMGWI